MTGKTETKAISRRAMLRRLGLAAGAAYVAPAMVGFNAAHASGASGASGGSGRGRGGSGASRSGPSRSGPSRSRPSRGRTGRSGASRPGRRGGGSAEADLMRMLRRLGF